jgi:hypothetical protein
MWIRVVRPYVGFNGQGGLRWSSDRRSIVMNILRIYTLAIPIFALFLFGGSWGAAAGDCSVNELNQCQYQCGEKFENGSGGWNACRKNCEKKYC